MAKDLELDSAGILEVLNAAAVSSAVRARAEQVATGVRGRVDAEHGVVVDSYTTDRAAASVTIRDVRGKLWEVRNGVLSSAAAGAGLDVNRR